MTPPPLRSVFCEFFWCVFDLRLWFYVYWNIFSQEKKSFLSNYLLFPAALSLNVWIAVKGRRNGEKTSIFEIPHNEMKCSWSYCSFSALISELMLYFTLRVLSIRSDPFQELHMIIQIDTESGQKTFTFNEMCFEHQRIKF